MWFSKIKNDITELPNAVAWFEQEYETARTELKVLGNVDKQSANLPGIVEQRFAQLQEIEAILEHLNIQMRKIKNKSYRKYLESYNRALSSRDADKFADGEEEVVTYEELVNEVAFLRNKWLGISKALESKQFQISNLIKLKTAGMEDFRI